MSQIAGTGTVGPLLFEFAGDIGATGSRLGRVFSGHAFSRIPLMPVVGSSFDSFGKKPFLEFESLICVTASAEA